uniref:EcsC family protein n=1 Tax=Micromonospora robiginosa TaxID=2749844 RepID=A0A7L6BE48_9ACTN
MPVGEGPARRVPAEKKAARKATRKAPATPRKTAVAPEFTAPAGAEPSPAGGAAVEEAGFAPRAPRARRTTKAAPAAKTSPAKRPAKRAPVEPPSDGTAGGVAGTRTDEPPAQAQPDQEQTTHEPAATGVAAMTRTPVEGWRAVAPRLRDHPGFAPELLALAAVDAIGPRARGWVAQVREAYPQADADGVARLATRRFVRMAGTGGGLAAGAGLFAPAAELAAVLWTQANLVLHMAAAYGHDPAHPDRAAELLVLTSVHPDEGAARAALAAARAAGEPADGPWGRVAEAAWRLATPVAAQAGGWLGLRLAARLLPGAAVLAAATGGTAAAERVAARAVGRYRRARQSQPNQDFGSSA